MARDLQKKHQFIAINMFQRRLFIVGTESWKTWQASKGIIIAEDATTTKEKVEKRDIEFVNDPLEQGEPELDDLSFATFL